jgi:hypothetical protein
MRLLGTVRRRVVIRPLIALHPLETIEIEPTQQFNRRVPSGVGANRCAALLSRLALLAVLAGREPL